MPNQLDFLLSDLRFARFQNELLLPSSYSDQYEDLYGIGKAYELQRKVFSEMESEDMAGWKVALCNAPAQTAFSSTEPAYGLLLEGDRFNLNKPIDVSRFHKPKLEVELGFIAADDFFPEDLVSMNTMELFSEVVPCVEVASSRYKGWTRNLFLFVADNSASGGFGTAQAIPISDGKSIDENCSVSINGEFVEMGKKDNITGGPECSLIWILKKLSERSIGLKKGQLLMSGSLIKPINISAGQKVNVSYLGQNINLELI